MTENLFEIVINLIETLITTDFVTRYLGSKYTTSKKTIAFAVCWAVAFLQMCIMNYVTEFETVGAFIPVVIYFVYALICLEGSVFLKLWVSFITYVLVYVIAVSTNLLLCFFLDYSPVKMVSVFNSTRVVGVIITKIALFYITRIILRNKYKYPLNKYTWLMIIFIPIISVISLGALMKAALYNDEIAVYVMIGIACIVMADVATYLFFVIMNKEYEKTLETKLFKQYNEVLMNNLEEVNTYVKEMRIVRHDIKNQLLTIRNYAEDGKNAEIIEYVQKLTNSALPKLSGGINTGNVPLDAVLNVKLAHCKKNDIKMFVYKEKGAELNIPQREIVVLFGNVLDNAIEAATKTKAKKIVVDISKKNMYLNIVVKNSIDESVLDGNPELNTTKSNSEFHGLGIKSVRKIVNSHNGDMRFYEEKKEFVCDIMILPD